MLALARKVNESIVINDDVEVTILEIKGDQVKIGIKAPKSVPIYRKELYLQIQKANEEAMNSADLNSNKVNFSNGFADMFFKKR